MKNKTTILLVLLMLFGSIRLIAQSNEELEARAKDVALEVLKAYKSRDLETLKKHASGVLKMAITDGYFEDEGLQDALKAVDEWDGTIKEIKFGANPFMGKNMYLATAYFADAGEGEIWVVDLSKLEGSPWVMFAMGIGDESRSDFDKMKEHIGGSTSEAKEKEPVEKKFSAEPAEGEIIENATEEQVVEMLKSLDKNNDWVSVSSDDGFIQFAWSKKGYTVQYRDSEGMFEADDLVNLETATKLLKDYMDSKTGWKDVLKWHGM
jgi:hypothetical protein